MATAAAQLGPLQGTPVVVLLGGVGVGKSLLATALSGLQPTNQVFKVGDSAEAVTLQATCHRARWFGRLSEEEVVLVDPPGVGDGERDASRLAQVVRMLRDFGYVSLFAVVLNAEQPRIGSVLENVLRLMEECFGKRFWRHVVLVFTRYYTDPHSARRRGNKTRDMMREEFSSLLAAQFPHSLEERLPRGEPFPSYFVDSEAAVNPELPEAERAAAFLELERFSVLARSSEKLSTHSGKDGGAPSSSMRSSSPAREPDSASEVVDPEDACTQFCVGSWVMVHSLVANPALNGAQGVVDEFQAEKGRYVVEFANGSRKLIHEKNLRPSQDSGSRKADPMKEGDLARISGLTHATALNGKVCRVQAPKGADRYDVKLADGEVRSVKGSNLAVLPAPGKPVTSSNVAEGAVVQRGPSWIWQDQDGGRSCLGRVLSFNTETGWATVQWHSGKTNRYRIGLDGKHDLEHADAFKHEASYLEALKKGKDALQKCHLQRSFAYLRGVKGSHVDLFDARDEICLAFGGHKHGQRVQVGGMQAVMIGVAPLDDDVELLSSFYHVDGAEGAGIFHDQKEFKKAKVVGRQKVREAVSQRVCAHNQNLLELAKDVVPTFRYVMAPRSLAHGRVERYDIRDEICMRAGGFKHGQVVQDSRNKALVIGVLVVDGLPRLFFHVDGRPGAGKYEDLEKKSFVVVGSRAVEEAPENFFEAPPPSAEVQDLARQLECTFSYPCGPHFAKLSKFDIRDHVCEAVGGFRHGQKVTDADGDVAVVVGVKFHDGQPQLFFHVDGHEGAGVYPKYYLVRRELKVVGRKTLEPASSSDPKFQRTGQAKKQHMREMAETLLKGFLKHATRSEQHTREFDPDFEFDFTFRYLQKSLDPAYFDIRDEVCVAVGGFKHGDVVEFLDNKAVVIGVRPDHGGTPHLWMHVEGSPGAGIFEDQTFVRLAGSVVGKEEVKEFEEPEAQSFSPEFVQGLRPTFSYPQGVKGRTKLALFDVRDEVCLHVGSFRHGEKVAFDEVQAVVIGVKLERMTPTMFFRVLKPFKSPGARTFENLDLMRPHMKSLGIHAVEEVTEEKFQQGWAGPSEWSGPGSEDSDASSHESSQEPSEPKAPPPRRSDDEMLGRAVLLRLSSCSALTKEVLLNSDELAECRRDVVDAACEVTPEWANGAVLLAPLTEEKASEAQLVLRAHHVVAFKGDEDRVRAALGALPCRLRPRIRESFGLGSPCATGAQDQECEDEEVESQAEGSGEELVVTVDRTFVAVFPRAPSEVSGAARSAPF